MTGLHWKPQHCFAWGLKGNSSGSSTVGALCRWALCGHCGVGPRKISHGYGFGWFGVLEGHSTAGHSWHKVGSGSSGEMGTGRMWLGKPG